MSRGRPIAGDPALSQCVEEVLEAIVAKPRDRHALAVDVATMRARIEREKPAADVFDVKLARGGLTDCEFAAQFLVLSGLGRVPGEATPATLARASLAGRAAPTEGERLMLSAALQTALLHVQRVAEVRSFEADHAPDALKQLAVAVADATLRSAGVGGERAGVASFEALRERLRQIQAQSREALEAVLGMKVDQRASGG